MEEKERLEKLEPAEDPADQGEKKEAMEAGSGRKDRREAGLNVAWPWGSAWRRPVSWGRCFLCRTGSRQCF